MPYKFFTWGTNLGVYYGDSHMSQVQPKHAWEEQQEKPNNFI